MKKVIFKVGRTTMSIEIPKAENHNEVIREMYGSFEIVEVADI